MGLVSVSESGHSCMKKMVTLHVPLRRNSQGKSFKIFLGEHRRGRQHNLKHKSQVLVAVALSVPSLPAAFDTMHDRTEHQMLMLQGQWSEKKPKTNTFNMSSLTVTPFADKDLQRCWACLERSGSNERGRRMLLQHPSNSSISFKSCWKIEDFKKARFISQRFD